MINHNWSLHLKKSVSHNRIESNVYDEDSVVNDVSSDCYTEIVLEDDGNQHNETVLKPSPIDKLLDEHTGTIQVVPIKSDTFHRYFTLEEHFMIICVIFVMKQMHHLILLIR